MSALVPLIAANMAPLMFASLIAFLLLGYPIAFSLGAVGILFAGIGIELGLFHPDFLQALPDRIYGVMSGETGTTLLAVPFFTFMGLVLERSGMAEDLLETVGQVFGAARGGIAYAVIFVGALLAATTGVVAASVISMGLISLPIMLRYGYDRRLAAGVIAASGTLAQIIPPSLVLIILADQLGRPVHLMYQAAFGPGLALAGLYAAYVLGVTLLWPAAAPGLPAEAIADRETEGGRGLPSLAMLALVSTALALWLTRGRFPAGPDAVVMTMAAGVGIALPVAVASRALEAATGRRLLSRLATRVTFVMVPPLFLIFLVLGTIFVGLATPTQGGAMGATGALALAALKRYTDGNAARFNFAMVRAAVEQTARLTSFVMFILIGARIFSLTFYGVDGHRFVEHLLIALPGGLYGFLMLVNLAVFVLAFFLDFFELSFIVVPLIKPAAEAIFRSSPEAIAIAKTYGLSVGVSAGQPFVVDVGPFMVWLGVLLAVNMQTSFMHPPFGFALMFLRSVAPAEPYTDRVTGTLTAPVTSPQIFWGAMPFVAIQLAMVATLALFPGLVLEAGSKVAAAPAIADSHRPESISTGSAARALRLMLPGSPPRLDGAAPPAPDAPAGPSLDLSEPPGVR